MEAQDLTPVKALLLLPPGNPDCATNPLHLKLSLFRIEKTHMMDEWFLFNITLTHGV